MGNGISKSVGAHELEAVSLSELIPRTLAETLVNILVPEAI